MAVNSLSLTTLENAKNYLGLSDGDLQINGLTVYHDGSASASAASVEVTDLTLILIIVGGANAGTNTFTFANAADDTLGEIVTQINALGEGWIANLQAGSSIDSGGLVITDAVSGLLVANIQTLDVVNNYLIEKTIDRASDVIETYCNRKFKSATYTGQLYDSRGGTYLGLRNYPITAVSRVSTQTDDAIDITNGSTAARATVQTTSSSLILTVVGGANAGTNTPDYATYSTVADMVTQVNAIGSGWTATAVPNMGIWPITELLNLPAQTCLTNAASLTVPDEPVADYEYYSDEGLLHRAAGWPRGSNNISVDYTAGFATIPDDLEQVCLELVAAIYNLSQQDNTVSSESIGDYSYSSGGGGSSGSMVGNMSVESKATMDKYKRILL